MPKSYKLDINNTKFTIQAWLVNFDPANPQNGGTYAIGPGLGNPIVTEPMNITSTSPLAFDVNLSQSDISKIPNSGYVAGTYVFTTAAVSPHGNHLSGAVHEPGPPGTDDEWTAQSQVGEGKKKKKTKSGTYKAAAS